MNEAPLYSYRTSGRRPGTIAAFCLFALILGFGITYGAPWYFLMPVGLFGLLIVWAIVANPQTGLVLTRYELQFFNRSTKQAVAVDDIAGMTVGQWSDGPDTVTLHLKSGQMVQVPSLCADSKLAPALRVLGITDRPAGSVLS